MRRQNAIYWPPGAYDGFGNPAMGALVELTLAGGTNNRVRWEESTQEFQTRDGTVQQSMAVVYVPVLPGGGEVQEGGYLWLGNRADLTDEDDPRLNPGAYAVRRFDKLPTLKATEYLRTVYL